MRAALLLSILLSILLMLGPVVARAAPFTAEGYAPLAETQNGPPHRMAAVRARRAALEQAIAGLPGSPKEAARQEVLAQSAAWTSAYRVLEQQDDGATIRVRVEVNIDLPRLAKRLAPRPTARPAGFVLGELELGPGCPDEDPVRIWLRRELVAQAELRRDGPGPRVQVSLACRELGPVPFTHLHASRVDTRVELGGRTLTSTGSGFDQGANAATRAALGRALGRVVADLAGTRAGTLEGVLVRVEPGAAAAAVRRMIKALRSSVVGVEGARLAGVDVDGGVRVVASTGLGGQELADRLRVLSVPGIAVTIVGHDAHRLSIALH